MAAPVRLVWNLHTRAAIDAAWAVLADTDRFNRNAGLGFRFEEKPRPDGTVERTGTASKLGLTLQWEELPFEFEAPEWFRSERRFPGGPVERVVATLALAATATGTDLRYQVELTPRNLLAWPVVAADARLTVQPQLDRALRGALAHLDDGRAWDPACPPLAPDADRRVAEACATLPHVGARLADHLRHAPLPRQDAMSALLLAERWQVPADLVIRELVGAVRAGILELRWDLLCPSCRGAKASRAALEGGSLAVHCPSCNLPYDGSFPDSLAVTFRPAAAIRRFEVAAACVLGPMRTPHVLAWQRLEPARTLTWSLDLEPGGYRLDTDAGLGGASLEVREGQRATEVTVDVTERGLAPAILRVAPGPVRIHLRSRLDRLVRARLDDRGLGRHVLTAGRLLETPGVRDLLPEGALTADVAVRPGVVVAIELLAGATTADLAPWLRGGWSRAEAGRALAVRDVAGALDLAASLARDPRFAVALGAGPVTWLGDTPAGPFVDDVVAAARRVGAGRVLLTTPGDAALVGEVARRDLKLKEREGVVRIVFPKREPEPVRVALRVGPYALGERLGVGGFGVVHAASGPAGDVVVKLLLPEVAADPVQAQRFCNEARLTAGIDHPNVVRVLDWGTADNGQLYLVLERLHGEELDRRLAAAGTLPVAEAVAIAGGVLAGLGAAHDVGVVHRDIKPSNLFLCDGPARVKIIDFGIAKAPDDPDDDADVAYGTPRYMSPEQVQGDPLDGRADLYAVGLVLYEALAGDIPFTAPTTHALAYVRTVETPAPLERRARPGGPAVPSALSAVVMRALAREPDDRWPDAAAMARALADAAR